MPARELRTGGQPANALKILVVDDSRAMRNIVTRTLRDAGFGSNTPMEASNGAEALRLARTACPDVILADWNMPVMDGLELVKALKAEHSTAAIGLITSNPAVVRAQALQAGALFVVAKPVSTDALRDALGPLVGDDSLVVPSADVVARLFATLVGRPVTAAPRHKPVFASNGLVVVGVYERDAGTPAALVSCDLPLAANASAAMSAVPADQARQSIAANALDDGQMENVRELLNVSARLLNGQGRGGLSLKGIHTQLRSLPPRAVALAVRPASQGLFDVLIPGYGPGGLSVCIG